LSMCFTIAVFLIHNAILSLKPTIHHHTQPRHVPSLPARELGFHFTRPRVFRQTRATPSTKHQPQLLNQITITANSQETLLNHHVRSNPPHHCPLPRAILPPNRPHPRQSPPAARRDSNHRRWWPDQCFFDTGMFIPDPPVWSRVLMDFVLMGIRVF
jgi:hypothetical protein